MNKQKNTKIVNDLGPDKILDTRGIVSVACCTSKAFKFNIIIFGLRKSKYHEKDVLQRHSFEGHACLGWVLYEVSMKT